jgi:hypothetical protein
METILQTIQSQSFIQAVLLVLITGFVVDLLVPRLKARVDQGNFERQKRFEEELSRSSKLREDCASLLDELESQLWEYQYLLLEPSYFVARCNEAGYKQSFAHYDERAPVLLSAIAAKISKLSRLADAETYRCFWSLLNGSLLVYDGQLVRLAEAGNLADPKWQQQHNRAYKRLGKEIEDSLFVLAQDFGFTKQGTSIRPSIPDHSDPNELQQ